MCSSDLGRSLFADAEAAEDAVEQIVRDEGTDDQAEFVEGESEFHGDQFVTGEAGEDVETLGGYGHEVRKQVLESNAVKLYNLPF